MTAVRETVNILCGNSKKIRPKNPVYCSTPYRFSLLKKSRRAPQTVSNSIRYRRGTSGSGRSKNGYSVSQFLLYGVAPFGLGTIGFTEGFKWLRENKISLGDARTGWYALAGSCLGVYLGWHYGASAFLSQWFQVYATRMTFTGWPTWLLSAFSHISLLHMAVNMFVGHSFIQGFNKANNWLEPFLVGALWSGFFCVMYGFFRNINAVGASGGICGIMGYLSYFMWENNRKVIAPMFPFNLVLDIPHELLKPYEINVPKAFTLREATLLMIGVSLVFGVRQIRTGRGIFAHAGHLGGILGGLFTAYNRDSHDRRNNGGRINTFSYK